MCTSNAAEISSRLDLFAVGEWRTLWMGTAASTASPDTTPHSSVPSDRDRPIPLRQRANRASNLIRAGELSRAAMALKSIFGWMGLTQDTKESLLSKHPPDGPLTEEAKETMNNLSPATEDPFSKRHVNEVITHSRRKALGDLSGWRTDHLRALVPFGITDIIWPLLMAAFHGDPCFKQGSRRLYGGRDIALAKPTPGVRPIAAQNVIIKVTGAAYLRSHKTALRQKFLPLQYAVATSCGTERVAFNLRRCLEARPGYALLRLDVTNAFNAINRTRVLAGLLELGLEDAVPFVSASYGSEKCIPFVDANGTEFCVESLSGTTQGESMATLFFCAGLQRILKETSKQFPEATIVAYADDIFILAPLKLESINESEPVCILDVWRKLVQVSALLDSNDIFHPGKTQLYYKGDDDEAVDDLMT